MKRWACSKQRNGGTQSMNGFEKRLPGAVGLLCHTGERRLQTTAIRESTFALKPCPAWLVQHSAYAVNEIECKLQAAATREPQLTLQPCPCHRCSAVDTFQEKEDAKGSTSVDVERVGKHIILHVTKHASRQNRPHGSTTRGCKVLDMV